MTRSAVAFALCSLLLACAPRGADSAKTSPPPSPPSPPSQAAGPATTLCQSIAADIEALRRGHPELAEFVAARAIEQADCRISYTYRCHTPTGRGGWTAAVPNPDPDGVWFYIGIWDPNDPSEASAQINTQPVIPRWMIGSRRVTFLMLEGKQTTPLRSDILAVLQKHGMR